MDALHQPLKSLQVLTNQQLTTLLTPAGTGGIQFAGSQSVTRWRTDPTSDSLGYFCYLRDLESAATWSLGYQPTCAVPDEYEVRFTPGRFTLDRLDHQIAAKLEVCVAAAHNFDLRRVTLVNRSSETRTLELTSYAEIVLQDPAADRGHPAFSKLFVETEAREGGLLIAHRRPRGSNENPLFACHFLIGDQPGTPPVEWETSRSNFIGRGRSLRNPAALSHAEPLSGEVGSVLDPIFSLRKTLILAPGDCVQLTFALGAERSRAALFESAEALADPDLITEIFDEADRVAVDQLTHQGIATEDFPAVLELAARRLLGLRETEENRFAVNGDSPDGLSGVGEFLAHLGIPRETHPISQRHRSTVHRSSAAPQSTQPRSQELAPTTAEESLLFDNGIGGFSADGREYVLRLRPRGDGTLELPPLPWNNVVSNPEIGFIASETGAGYTWAGNSRLNRLTPWQNDPICDPHSEAFYLRDEASGEFWSLTPGPIPRSATYEVRHGWGYTTFRHTTDQLQHEVVQFVPREGPVKITRIRLTNPSDQPRQLTLFGYAQWDLSEGSLAGPRHTETTIDPARCTIFATNSLRQEYTHHTAFATLVGPARRMLAVRRSRGVPRPAPQCGRSDSVGEPRSIQRTRRGPLGSLRRDSGPPHARTGRNLGRGLSSRRNCHTR